MGLRSCADSHFSVVTAVGDAVAPQPVRVRGDETDLWIFDKSKKTLTNSHSARCLGPAVGPGPSPGPSPSGNLEAVVTAAVNGEVLYSKEADGRYWTGNPPAGAAFIGTGVHFAQFDDFAVEPSQRGD